MTKENIPGTGHFECDEDGLVVERFVDGSCSFDIFNAAEWPGTDKDGLAYASLIICALHNLDITKARGEKP